MLDASAVVVGILAMLGTLGGSYFANSKTTAVMQEQIKDVKSDIATLSKRVDAHNNLVERMAIVEQSTKSVHKRVDRMEGK